MSIAHAYDFKDITNISYAPDPVDTDACTVFELQKKYTFGILVTTIKESSAQPIIRKYSDPNAIHYGDAQLLYDDLVSHYTKGLTGSQRLEIIERDLDELLLDMKWSKTCESFLNMVDNHQGIAPDPMQFPDSWYITQLNRTLEPHTTLYQYIINQQLQATSIANHLGTTSATTISFESHVETVRIFCQTIDHTNRKALQEKNRRKALQAEFQKPGGRGRAGRQSNTGGCGHTGGRTEGRGRGDTGGGRVQGRGGRTSGRGRSQGRYHNWVPCDQFDNLSNEEYQTLIRERLTRGELQAHHADTDPANPIPDASSTGTGAPTYPTSPAPPHSVSMAIATSNPSSTGTTTSSSMDTGPHTLLRQLHPPTLKVPLVPLAVIPPPLHPGIISIMSLTELLPKTVRPHTLVPLWIVVLTEEWPGPTPDFSLPCPMPMSISLALVVMYYNVSLLSNVHLWLIPLTKGPLS